MKRIVIALGGNALLKSGLETPRQQYAIIQETARHLTKIIKMGCEPIVSHGNGPQVGKLAIQNEKDPNPLSFDTCVAMSQGMIGYPMQRAWKNILREEGIDKTVFSIVTQTVVDKNDPAFNKPTKPIGPFYTELEAQELMSEKKYQMMEDSGRGWRRVVASPDPKSIVEIEAIVHMLNQGYIVISTGGGGIPVTKDEKGMLSGAIAVIDKDKSSQLLARETNADALLILTAVDKVCLNFGKPNQKTLSRLSASEARQYLEEGHFGVGSMQPKIEAALSFVENQKGKKAIIGALDNVEAILNGDSGTFIEG